MLAVARRRFVVGSAGEGYLTPAVVDGMKREQFPRTLSVWALCSLIPIPFFRVHFGLGLCTQTENLWCYALLHWLCTIQGRPSRLHRVPARSCGASAPPPSPHSPADLR